MAESHIDHSVKYLDCKTRHGLIYIYGYCLFGNITSILGPLIPLKARDGGNLETDYSIVFTFRGIGGVVGSILITRLENRYSAHEMLMFASIMAALLCFLNMSEDGISLNVVEWFLMGLGGSFI